MRLWATVCPFLAGHQKSDRSQANFIEPTAATAMASASGQVRPNTADAMFAHQPLKDAAKRAHVSGPCAVGNGDVDQVLATGPDDGLQMPQDRISGLFRELRISAPGPIKAQRCGLFSGLSGGLEGGHDHSPNVSL